VKAIQTGKSVRTLDLRRNCIGDEGAVALAELLKSNHKLHALQLAHNQIRDKGAQALAKVR
jgi:Ran GTPase-activating protein (RanGAP) involved in mRNA processing and transport